MKSIAQVADIHQGLVTTGRGAGARPGDWRLTYVESAGVSEDGWLDLEGPRGIETARGWRTERHLLRPYDVLITARAVKTCAVLVPSTVSRTVAGATMLVVRPKEPGSGMGHYLWYFLTSSRGMAELDKLVTTSAMMRTLSARDLGKIRLPIPSSRELRIVESLVEASEEAFSTAIKVAKLRRESLRNSVIGQIVAKDAQQNCSGETDGIG